MIFWYEEKISKNIYFGTRIIKKYIILYMKDNTKKKSKIQYLEKGKK